MEEFPVGTLVKFIDPTKVRSIEDVKLTGVVNGYETRASVIVGNKRKNNMLKRLEQPREFIVPTENLNPISANALNKNSRNKLP